MSHTRFAFILPIALLATIVQFASGAQEHPRRRVLLDANWRFRRGEMPGAIAGAQGDPIIHWRWIASEDKADAEKMAAPGLDTSGGAWKDAASGDDVFHGRLGMAWFRAALPEGKGSGYVLHFEGVDDNGTVYLNGRRLAHHEGWNDPFDVDLAPAWKEAGPNELAVLVENTAGAGGITAPVRLEHAEAGVAAGPAGKDYDDHDWSVVHLPHDFIVEGAFSPQADASHGSLPTTTGWYRLNFDVSAADQGKSLWIDFDGIYRDSKVWLNGHFLGRHASGYTGFRYDVARYVNYGGANVLAVYVDPRHFEGWWYEGGGIYRHVWLNVADPVHLAPWGTFVSAQLPEPKSSISTEPAQLTIKTTIANTTSADAAITIVSRIVDAAGHDVATVSTPATVPAGKEFETSQATAVSNPNLWSPETPYLYRLRTSVQRDGREIDADATLFGIRTIRFDADKGFFLNGKPVKIQGTCNHQDFAGVGIGVPDTLQYWRVRQLQRMGANAWRMSHNPPTPALLDACDELGMLVMDENRKVGDSEQNLADLVSMIRRDRNHPSIIIWSMCNEEWGTQGTPQGARIFSHMMDTVHKHDTTRPISCAQSDTKTWGKGFSTVEDLQGCNYGSGRDYDRFHAAFPKQPIYGSETASTLTTRGEYANDRQRAFVTSYNMTDGAWKPIADRPWMAGAFVWTGFDYKGEPTPYRWPCINSHFGILDMCGFPKDNYYYYQSWWKTQPTVHLMPHWNWPGKEGAEIRVIAFGNCSRVELFLNGQSLGAKAMPRNEHLEWRVKYAPGRLLAKGYDAGGQAMAADAVETTGPPAALRVNTERPVLLADGEDVAPVKVEVLDAQDRVVPTADDRVTFQVTGAGSVAGVGNGNPSDHDSDQARFRRAFHGLCMVVVRAAEVPGEIHLTATAPGLKPARLDLKADGPSVSSQQAKAIPPRKSFIDYFLPMPIQGSLSKEAWGAAEVGPRDQKNGLEDPAMRQWNYWDGQIIKAPDGKYHLFASRWEQARGHWAWPSSKAVYAVSDYLIGPYADKGLCWPGDEGGKGHNVTALALPDGRYAVVISETRPGTVYVSDSLDGPWKKLGTIRGERLHASNISIMLRRDGDYMIVPRSGQVFISKAADGILGPYRRTGSSVFPRGIPNLEDPVIFYSGGLYHVVVNSWSLRKAFHLTSKDGKSGWVNRGVAYDPTTNFCRYADGTVNHWNKLERPGVVLENGHVVAMTFAVIDTPKESQHGNDGHGSKIIVVPFDGAALDRDLQSAAGQAKDIIFHAPKKQPDGTVQPGSFTVLQNGVLIQDRISVDGRPTTAAPLHGMAEKGPLYLQDHGNPVRFRNIWVRRL